MSELNEVKKKLGEAFGLLWLTLRVKFARPSSGHKRRRRRHTKLKIIVVLVCLAVGGGLIFFSSPGSVSGDPSNLGLGAGGSNFSLIRFLFAPVIPVPGLQRDGSFVLSDFEQVDDMKAWSVVSATMKPSVTHVSTGAQSAKMTLYGGGDVAAVQIEDYFTSKKGVSDWSSFEYLSFYIFNPQRVSEKLILQVKDQNGRYFKEDIHVPASGGEEFKIPVEKIGAFLDITRIDQFSLFAWQMKGEKEFYLDDLKLLLRGYRDIERRAAETAVPLKIRPVKPLDYGFAYRKPAWMAVDTQGGGNIVRIPFVVANETNAMCALCPVEGGVPMPLGEKTNVTKMRVRDSQGRDLQFQARVLSRWTDGSVKWLGVSFPLTLGPREGQGFVLEYGQNINTIDFSTDLHAQESGEDILISTGPMRVKLSKQNFTLFDEVYVDKNSDGMFDKDELLVSAAPLVLTHNDTEFRTDVTGEDYKIEIEEQGPYRVVVKASGWFQAMKGKDRFGKVVLRYYFYSGRGYVKLSHTLIYTGYPANKQFLEYESLKLPENETIQSFGFRLPYQLSFQGIPEVKTGVLAPGQPLVFQGGNSIRVAQLKWDQTVVQTDDVMMPTNALASGWIQVADEQSGITVAVKDFRELFPKALGVDHGKKEVIVDLWPAEAGELDLKTTPPALGVGAAARGSAFGLGKTH
ncbi:MAG: hypothetical protein Q8R76_11090 [Candidatus Omnitrophota bacterium]|nr:hypothetical protein [Candidatus Omnitrophota bacterium]